MHIKFLVIFILCSNLLIGQKIVLISGASQGLGKELAETYAQNGWSVWAGTRTPEKVIFVNPNIHAIFLDVSNTESVDQVIDKIIKHEGKIDLLINNAAYLLIAPPDTNDLEAIHQMMEVNFYGVKVSLVEPGIINTPWSKNCVFVASESFHGIYESILDRLLEKTAQGQDCKEVARFILDLSEKSSTLLRNPTSLVARAILESRLTDPSGTTYLNQQESFLKMLRTR